MTRSKKGKKKANSQSTTISKVSSSSKKECIEVNNSTTISNVSKDDTDEMIETQKDTCLPALKGHTVGGLVQQGDVSKQSTNNLNKQHVSNVSNMSTTNKLKQHENAVSREKMTPFNKSEKVGSSSKNSGGGVNMHNRQSHSSNPIIWKQSTDMSKEAGNSSMRNNHTQDQYSHSSNRTSQVQRPVERERAENYERNKNKRVPKNDQSQQSHFISPMLNSGDTNLKIRSHSRESRLKDDPMHSETLSQDNWRENKQNLRKPEGWTDKQPHTNSPYYRKFGSNEHQGQSDVYKEFLYWNKTKYSQGLDWKLIEKKGDLFTAPEEYSLAHCVAEDFRMGSGIAVGFRDKFKKVEELLDQRQKTGGLAILEDRQRFIYYLVTKQYSQGKPTMDSLLQSLIKLREHMRECNVTKLAIPTLGCGLDRLDWRDVSKMIQFVFENDDVEIVVYIFEQGDDNEEKITRRSAKIVNRDIPLVDIEAQTILLFIASRDHEITSSISELNKKYYFIFDYKQDVGQLGNIFCTIKKNELIVGLYAKEKHTDRLSFVQVVSCLQNLFKYLRRLKYVYYYIGIDTITDEHDEMIMTKLETVMRNSLYDFEVHICKSKTSAET